ncbi:GNAT family N-acetyltransferase [Nonomuraea sp. NPDC003214]
MSQSPTLSVKEIRTDRLLLRRAVYASDRDGLIELSTDPEVQAHLGGPRPLDEVERHLGTVMAAGETSTPGSFIVADTTTGEVVGSLMLSRRPADRDGHVTEEGGELELGYLLRRHAWGAGYAFEATTAALRAAAAELPDQPVLIVTQSANARSLRLAARLGFRPVSTFHEYDAEQTLCTAPLAAFRA